MPISLNRLLNTILDRTFRNKMNENFDMLEVSYNNIEQNSQQAVNSAQEAKQQANRAESKANSVQEQFNQVVIKGDSSIEAAQARVGADGKAYFNLKDRLDGEFKKNSDQIGILSDLPTSIKTDLVKALIEYDSWLNLYGINVKRPPYNAKGNGSDDSAAIQAAIDKAYSNGGGTVIIPEGVFFCNIIWKKGVRIRGNSVNSTILRPFSNGAVITVDKYVSNGSLENFAIWGKRSDAINDGLYFPRSNGSTPWTASTAFTLNQLVNVNGNLYKCTVAGTSGSAPPSHTTGSATDGTVTWLFMNATLSGIWECQFRNLEIHDCGRHGINIDAGDYYQANQYSVFENVHCRNNVQSGIYIKGFMQNNQFTRLVCRENGSHGMVLDNLLYLGTHYNPNDNTFLRCVFESNKNGGTCHGVNSMGRNNTYKDCWFENNGNDDVNQGSAGFYNNYISTTSTGNRFEGCHFNSQFIDIWFYTGHNNVIDDNNIFDWNTIPVTKPYSIRIDDQSQGNKIGRQLFSIGSTPPIVVGGNGSYNISRNNKAGKTTVSSGQTSVAVTINELTSSVIIMATPTWNTNIWLTNVTKTGFTINFGTAPTVSSTVYWTVD